MSQNQDNPWIELAPGIKRQTIASGTLMYQMRAQLDAGSKMPEHKHVHEQIAYVVAGRMKLIVNGEPHELGPGDSFYIGSNVVHGVETIEDTTVIDTFSPPRDEYLSEDGLAKSEAA